MSLDPRTIRTRCFQAEYLAWTALGHFLSADLARECFTAIVGAVGGDRVELEGLVEEATTSGSAFLLSWAFSPRNSELRSDRFLQSLLRSWAWKHDAAPSLGLLSPENEAHVPALRLEAAMRLGRSDLSNVGDPAIFGDAIGQPGIEALGTMIATLAEGPVALLETGELTALMARVDGIPTPLGAVMLKHAGDLCADVDAWMPALELYEEAERRLADEADAAWLEFIVSLRAMAVQSKASALRTIEGPGTASKALAAALACQPLGSAPLLHVNASHDAFVAEAYSEAGAFLGLVDARTSVMSAPQLLHHLDPASALQSWRHGEYQDASTAFWALLRRQVALGSASESRATKSLFGECIFDDLAKATRHRFSPDVFSLACRLVVESGDPKALDGIEWAPLVGAYVGRDIVEDIERRAQSYAGARAERLLVAMAIFGRWLAVLSPREEALAAQMLLFVATTANIVDAVGYHGKKLGKRSYEILQRVAAERPEFRKGVAAEAAQAVIATLVRQANWTVTSEALRTSHAFADAFDEASLQAVVDAVLSKLDGMDPAAGLWPVVRPALDLLTLGVVKNLAKRDPVRGARILGAVLRFGLAPDTEHTRLLHYLADFDGKLAKTDVDAAALRAAVDHVRERASDINSTAAIENIQALLLAPGIVGSEGIDDALDALGRVIATADHQRPSLSFAYAYSPLLLLARRRRRLAEDLGEQPSEFDRRLHPLLPLVAAVWTTAAGKPLILTSFSLQPATTPDREIVHNWAYASSTFAKALDDETVVPPAIAAASHHPLLRDAIALSHASGALFGKAAKPPDPEDVLREDRDAFYASLGQRVVALRGLEGEARTALCDALLRQCFRFGPRFLDAAVHLSALDCGARGKGGETETADYLKRLAGDRDLRMALGPALAELGLLPPSRPEGG